jgi:hypothetical protein
MNFTDIKPSMNLEDRSKTNVVILNGDTESSTLNLGGFCCLRLLIPTGFVTGFLTFYCSYDQGVSWYKTRISDGTYLSVPVAAGDDIFMGNMLIGLNSDLLLKVVSSSIQTSDISIRAICSPVFGKI